MAAASSENHQAEEKMDPTPLNHDGEGGDAGGGGRRSAETEHRDGGHKTPRATAWLFSTDDTSSTQHHSLSGNRNTSLRIRDGRAARFRRRQQPHTRPGGKRALFSEGSAVTSAPCCLLATAVPLTPVCASPHGRRALMKASVMRLFSADAKGHVMMNRRHDLELS